MGTQGNYGSSQGLFPPWVKRLIIGAVAFILLLIFWPFSCVSSTERGVIKTFGEVGNSVLMPGLRVKLPVAQTIKMYDLTPNIINIAIAVGDDSPVTKDQQAIGVKGAYAWMYDENEILSIARRFSNEESLKKQINDNILSAIRQAIGNYEITNIVQTQAEISARAKTDANKLLTDANLPAIITQLNLNNWDWTEEYDKQIRETVATRQAVLRQAAEADRVEQEQRKILIEAEASAKAAIASAEGRKQAAKLDAEAKIAEGQGIAEYNRLIAMNMGTQREKWAYEIEMVKWGKWNGVNTSTYLPLNPAGGIVTLPGTPGAK